jgi:glycosyltransferase involved in cell wall biosynthesis
VKLLEAFACGIAAVSTPIGAEGLASGSEAICEIAESPGAFAEAVLHLLDDEGYRVALAQRARAMVEQQRNSRTTMKQVAETYHSEVRRLRPRR